MYDEKLKKLKLNKYEFHVYGYLFKLLSNSQILIDMKSKISLNNVNFEQVDCEMMELLTNYIFLHLEDH